MTKSVNYEAPRLRVIGELRALTLGGKFSCVDGCSGNVGNKGVGNCNGTSTQHGGNACS
jgi:hypothetical protein